MKKKTTFWSKIPNGNIWAVVRRTTSEDVDPNSQHWTHLRQQGAQWPRYTAISTKNYPREIDLKLGLNPHILGYRNTHINYRNTLLHMQLRLFENRESFRLECLLCFQLFELYKYPQLFIFSNKKTTICCRIFTNILKLAQQVVAAHLQLASKSRTPSQVPTICGDACASVRVGKAQKFYFFDKYRSLNIKKHSAQPPYQY